MHSANFDQEKAISIAMQSAPEIEMKIWMCHIILLLNNNIGKNKILIRTLCPFRVDELLFLGGSQRQQPATMFNIGAEGNVQLQQVSILDMHICSTSVKEDSDWVKGQDTVFLQ